MSGEVEIQSNKKVFGIDENSVSNEFNYSGIFQ